MEKLFSKSGLIAGSGKSFEGENGKIIERKGDIGLSISRVKLSDARSEQIAEISARIHILLGELYADQIGMKRPKIKIIEREERNAS